MVSYEKLYQDVKNKLSEKRFRHSELVVKRALEYAEIYNVDKEIVRLCAIAHDIAKEFTDEENMEYITKYDIKLDEIEKKNKSLIHAKVGAEVLKHEYGFTEDMVNAVKYHTTGRENMSVLEKIICLADATEESRDYLPKEYVSIIKEDIDRGMVEICKWCMNYILSDNKMLHLDTVKCYNYYLDMCKTKTNP
ncbi:MAG: bis(5'-nucleosyl)-tetraphosphatase (symmetrical) YqeK [Clostridia bacterium]|nr:bis(5'-nucleosyl)-tetraphosphatase (symmetrical) YqeK [Clostridia bacterium]